MNQAFDKVGFDAMRVTSKLWAVNKTSNKLKTISLNTPPPSCLNALCHAQVFVG